MITKHQEKSKENLIYGILLVIFIFLTIPLRLKFLYVDRLWPDEALYAWYALKIFNNPAFLFSAELTYPPLFPIILSLAHGFFDTQYPEIACRFMMNASYTIGLAAIYFLGMRIRNAYLGFTASLILAFNYIYYSGGTLILIDQPLAVVNILFAISLLSIQSHSKNSYHILVGAISAAGILLKWSEVLLIPWMCIYYLSADNIASTFRERIKKFLIALSATLSAIVYLALRAAAHGQSLIPSTTALKGVYFKEHLLYYFANFYPWILNHISLLVLFILGLLCVIFFETKNTKILLLSWLTIYVVALSLVGEKVLRYMLPVLPCIIIITAIGLEKVPSILLQTPRLRTMARTLLMIMIISLSYPMARAMDLQTLFKAHGYIGFYEASRWLNQTSSQNYTIYTNSSRAFRYYQESVPAEKRGRLVRYPRTKEDFIKGVTESKNPSVAIIDRWEITQPSWIRPITKEVDDLLLSLNFQLEKVIDRQLPVEVKAPKMITKKHPVIFIYVRNPHL